MQTHFLYVCSKFEADPALSYVSMVNFGKTHTKMLDKNKAGYGLNVNNQVVYTSGQHIHIG